MTISRAQMGSQLKGNKMYKKSSVGSILAEVVDGKKKDKDKKPVRAAKYGGKTKKKSLGGALAGGMAKEGMIPLMGVLPMAYNAMKKKKAKAAAQSKPAKATQASVPVAKYGGKIGRGDGCAVRGRTKGTMR